MGGCVSKSKTEQTKNKAKASFHPGMPQVCKCKNRYKKRRGQVMLTPQAVYDADAQIMMQSAQNGW